MMLLCHPIMIGFSQDVASLQTAPKPSVQTISTNSKTPLINQYWKKKKHHIKRKQHIKVNDLIAFHDADHISLPMAIYFSQKIHLDKIKRHIKPLPCLCNIHLEANNAKANESASGAPIPFACVFALIYVFVFAF